MIREVDWKNFSSLIDEKLMGQEQLVNVEQMTNLILEVAEKCFKKTNGTVKRAPLPYWNVEIHKANKERKKAQKKYQQQSSISNKIDFQKKRAHARFVKKQARRNKWQEIFNTLNCHTPVGVMWNLVSSMKRKKKKNEIKTLKIFDDEKTDEPLIMAEIFAQLFEKNSATESYTSRFRRHKKTVESRPFRIGKDAGVMDEPFTLEELESALSKCHEGSPGPDSIHFNMIKNLSEMGKLKLLEGYNKMWKDQTFPASWGEAVMVPIPKPGRKIDDPESHRPVSLTNCPCKLFEKMTNARLVWHLEVNNCLSDKQFGFRKSRGTSDVHVVLETEASEAFRRKEHLIVVSLDMTKAFNRVRRRRILDNLKRLGINGNMLNGGLCRRLVPILSTQKFIYNSERNAKSFE